MAGAVVELAGDSVAAGVVVEPGRAVPDDDETAAGQRRDSGPGLLAVGIGVDQEFRTHRGARGIERSAVDAPARAVMAVAVPDRDEAAVGQRDDLGIALLSGGVLVEDVVGARGELAGRVDMVGGDAPGRAVAVGLE